jgi:hypothetical protein
MRPTIAAALLLLVVTSAWAADLEGGWKGTWTKDGDALPVTVTFEKSGNGYSGHSIPTCCRSPAFRSAM